MSVQFNTLCKENTLYDAWKTVKPKGSAGGIDGVTIREFDEEKYKQLTELAFLRRNIRHRRRQATQQGR